MGFSKPYQFIWIYTVHVIYSMLAPLTIWFILEAQYSWCFFCDVAPSVVSS